MRPIRAARFILVWFALSVGAAIASPWIKPQPMQIVCSGASSMLVAVDGDDASHPGGSQRLDCPACLFFHAPATVASITVPAAPESAAFVVQAIAPDPIALASAAPLPARGPPLRA